MAPSQECRNRLLLVLSGFNLILLNYTLLRQTMLAFRDLETSALVMTLAYFTGVSVGYRWSDLVGTRLVRALLPVFLIAQTLLITLTPLLVDTVRPVAGTTGASVAIFVLVAAGSTSLYSLILPGLIQAEAGSTRRYYSAEIVGSLAGVLLLAVLSLGGMLPLLAAYFACFLAIAALLGLRRLTLALLLVYGLGFTLAFDAVDRRLATALYRRLYAGRGIDGVVFTRYSPYHKIEVATLRTHERALLLNHQWQFGPASHETYSYFVAEYPSRWLRRPVVAILGCGSMSTVGRIGDHAASISIVDLDAAVFETSRRYFAEFNRLSHLQNWTFVSDDAKHFLGTTTGRFDLIVDDIPPARTRQLALTYTREFFELVRARLTPQGIFSLPSLVSVSARSGYGRRILATLARVFEQVVVVNDGSSSYFFATSRETPLERGALYEAIAHAHKRRVRILMPDEVRALVAGERIITVNNMADLIEE